MFNIVFLLVDLAHSPTDHSTFYCRWDTISYIGLDILDLYIPLGLAGTYHYWFIVYKFVVCEKSQEKLIIQPVCLVIQLCYYLIIYLLVLYTV